MTNLDSTLKNKYIALSRKDLLVKAMVFQVVMYGCENWTIKKAEHQRIAGFFCVFFFFNYLFIRLSGLSAVAHGIFHCGTETALSGCSVRA